MHFPHEYFALLVLSATIIFAGSISRMMRISPTAMYLCCGALGFYFLPDTFRSLERFSLIGETGILFLLFLLGVETPMHRLVAMKRYVFGLGSTQVLLSAAVIYALLSMVTPLLGLGTSQVLFSSLVFAFSSTAVALTILAEKNKVSSLTGRICISVLLFQDFIAVMLFAITAFLGKSFALMDNVQQTITLPFLGIIFLLGMNQVLLRYKHRLEKRVPHERVWAISMISLLGYAYIGDTFLLPMEMSAFFAGMLWSQTRLRHMIEHELQGFSKILMGFFFIQVGAQIDMGFFFSHAHFIVLWSMLLSLCKLSILTPLSKFIVGTSWTHALKTSLYLAGASEFALVFFSSKNVQSFLGTHYTQWCFSVSVFSLFLSPLLFLWSEKWIERHQSVIKIAPPSEENLDIKS